MTVMNTVGSSAVGYPAAGLVDLARQAGARVVEVNADASAVSSRVDVHLRGKSGEILPRLVQLLAEPGVTQGTMMGYPCLRANGAFFACIERATGHLIVKLPAHRVSELAATGQALPFAPNGRTFREWAAFPVADPAEWRALLAEAARCGL